VSTNQVYFAQICRTSGATNNITIKRVDASGGVPNVVQTREQQRAAINPSYIFDVVGNDLYLSIEARAPGQLLTPLDLTAATQSDTIYTGDFFQNAIEFDLSARQTFTCGLSFVNATSVYTLDRFDGILGQTGNANDSEVLYTLQGACTAVRKQANSNDLFFATQELPNPGLPDFVSNLYKGSSDCVECNVAPTTVFSLSNQRIDDFDVTADRIFFGTSTGVFSTDLSGGNKQHISFSAATGVRVLGNRVYWNSGTSILSVNLSGSDLRQVNQFGGTCGCKLGFTGSSCSTCAGQVQWLNGQPSCVSLGEDGNPVSCSFDYQCRNNPNSYCAGSCMCQPGLTGAACDQCSNSTQSIVWVNGIPACR